MQVQKMEAIISNPSATQFFSETDDNASIAYIGTTEDNSWRGGTLHWSDNEEFDKRRQLRPLLIN